MASRVEVALPAVQVTQGGRVAPPALVGRVAELLGLGFTGSAVEALLGDHTNGAQTNNERFRWS